ncbi:NFACT family protein [Marinicrinis lubricantis]|uniref:Rqc2 homolog RqcH n=1 Tax=Marinicrinis lubricantis TaxID=2086470 RepID=A0ABW1IMQ4_9BACL
MATDGLFLYKLTHELASLTEGRINKIHQPADSDIVMQIRAAGKNVKLLLSANPTYPRVHLTEKQYHNPLEAPMFCMLLRKHCEGGIIQSVEQPDLERVLKLHIRQRDELGDLSMKTVIIEIMGRHSNIILLDAKTNTVLDSIHHVTPAVSSYRIVMPGQPYTQPPKQDKKDPFIASSAEILELLKQTANNEEKQSMSEWVVQQWKGISPLAAKELLYRSGIDEKRLVQTLEPLAAKDFAEKFTQFMQSLRAEPAFPCIKEEPRKQKFVYYCIDLLHIEGNVRTFATLSSLLEEYYGDKAERDTIKQKTGNLKRLLQNERNKNEKKIEKLKETLTDADHSEKYRIYGELLTASLHAIPRGSTEVEVVNYYDEEQAVISIALDPALSPAENAQRYFKRYSKAKNSVKVVQEQMKQAEEEIIYLDNLLQQLEYASLADVEEMREELIEQGYVRDRGSKQRRKKKSDKPKLLRFTSSEGIDIYVGKNNTQNDYLTNRVAGPADTWLHTKDIPGSHVVIRSQQFGDATLEEAAMLAAYYSQAKESSLVPVDYTFIRHVRKPSGAKPGFVIYDHQKTLFVTPDPEKIEQMKSEIV